MSAEPVRPAQPLTPGRSFGEDPELGELARRRSALRRRRLTLEDVQVELGALASLDDAARWLRVIAGWALAGLVPGTVANASVRAVDVWLRQHETRLTEHIVGELRGRLEHLEAELKQRRGAP